MNIRRIRNLVLALSVVALTACQTTAARQIDANFKSTIALAVAANRQLASIAERAAGIWKVEIEGVSQELVFAIEDIQSPDGKTLQAKALAGVSGEGVRPVDATIKPTDTGYSLSFYSPSGLLLTAESGADANRMGGTASRAKGSRPAMFTKILSTVAKAAS